MSHPNWPLMACLLSAAASFPVPVLALPPIVVVDSRVEPDFGVQGPIDRRVTQEQKQITSPRDAKEMLQSQPSVDALGAGGAGGLSFVSIRGGDPNFTLFLLDGIKLNDPTNSRGGGVDLYMIPQQMIDSVDVSARPASAIRGSDGLSGTVSFTTRPVIGALVDGGIYDKGSAWGAVSVGEQFSATTEGSATIGRESRATGAENDSLRQSYLLLRGRSGLAGIGQIDFTSFVVDGIATGFPEDSGGDRLAVIRDKETRDYRRRVLGINSAWPVGEGAAVHADGSWSSLDESIDNPGIAPGVLAGVPALTSEREYERWNGELFVELEPAATARLSAGVAYESEDGRTDDVIDFGGFLVPASFHLQRSMWSGFTELALRPVKPLKLVAGARYDMPEGAKDELSLNLAASYDIRDHDMELSASFGQGYKQPSMFALGHSLVGNPDLEPEYSEAVDIGLLKRWPSAGIELGVSVFRNDYRDLVDFDPVLFTNVNRGRVVTKGFDAQLGWQVDRDVELSLHVTHSDADIIGSDDELRRRPDWKGGAQLLWQLPYGVEWQTSARYNGRYFDSSVPTGVVEMPAYWAVDTTVGWTTSESARWSLTVKNLFDDDFEESVGFSNGGRAVGLSLQLVI